VTVIERVTVTVPLDPFMSLKALSAYSSLSVRKLRQLIDRDPADALPAYRVDDRVLVRRSEFDEWMQTLSRLRATWRRGAVDSQRVTFWSALRSYPASAPAPHNALITC
jgi:hypothetical protein